MNLPQLPLYPQRSQGVLPSNVLPPNERPPIAPPIPLPAHWATRRRPLGPLPNLALTFPVPATRVAPLAKMGLWQKLKAIPGQIATAWRQAWTPTWAGVPKWVHQLWEASGRASIAVNDRLRTTAPGRMVISAIGTAMAALWTCVDWVQDVRAGNKRLPGDATWLEPVAPALPRFPSSLPWLATSGNQIIDQAGKPVRLRGINLSGLEMKNSVSPATPERLDRLKAMGSNVVRLPINQRRVLNEPGYLELLDAAVSNASQRGIYILLDLHWLDGHQTALPDEASARMWRRLAARYANQPGVLYDLHNEPGWVGWQTNARWSEFLIRAIRSVNPRSLVMVEGTAKGQRLAGALTRPIDAPNIVYEAHVYGPLQHGPGVGPTQWERLFGRLSERFPLFVGEFGGETREVGVIRDLLAYADRKGLGWSAWHCDGDLFDRNDKLTPMGELVAEGLKR